MMSASNTRLRYIGSRAIGFVIQHSGKGTPSVYWTPLDAPEPPIDRYAEKLMKSAA
jgi:hypothetical protein